MVCCKVNKQSTMPQPVTYIGYIGKTKKLSVLLSVAVFISDIFLRRGFKPVCQLHAQYLLMFFNQSAIPDTVSWPFKHLYFRDTQSQSTTQRTTLLSRRSFVVQIWTVRCWRKRLHQKVNVLKLSITIIIIFWTYDFQELFFRGSGFTELFSPFWYTWFTDLSTDLETGIFAHFTGGDLQIIRPFCCTQFTHPLCDLQNSSLRHVITKYSPILWPTYHQNAFIRNTRLWS